MLQEVVMLIYLEQDFISNPYIMLGIDQLEDYQDELVKLEDEINFEDKIERIRELQARRDEIINVLSRDKEDRAYFMSY